MGRTRGSVHQRGAGGGDDTTTETGQSTFDPYRAWRRLSIRRLTNEPRSLRDRIIFACLLFFTLGVALGPVLAGMLNNVWSITNFYLFGGGVFAEKHCIYNYEVDHEVLACQYQHISNTFLDQLLWIVALVSVLALVALLIRLACGRVARPLRTMANVVRAMGPQNLGQRIKLSSARDELTQLADSIDDMLGRVAVGYEAQRRFASNASHELRTPLAVQRTLVEVAMLTNSQSKKLGRLGSELLLVNQRNEALIEGLLVLAESDQGLKGTVPVRLDELVESVLDAYEDMAAESSITLHRTLTPRTVSGDPVLLERMLTNLVRNAIKYNRPIGWVQVSMATSPTLTVHNTGRAIPAHAVDALFEPFRRLAEDRTTHSDGAGLGLSIVRSIVAVHDGTLHAQPRTDGGLCIDITLPESQ